MNVIARVLRLNIGKRVYLGFSLVLAVMLAEGVLSIAAFQLAASRFQSYAEVDRAVNEIHEIENNVMDLQRSVLIYTFSGYDGVVARIRLLQDTLKQQFESLKPTIQDDERKEIISRMYRHFLNYIDNFDAALGERHLGEALSKSLNKTAAEISDALSLLLAQMMEHEDSRMAAMLGQAQNKFLIAHQNMLAFDGAPDSALIHEFDGQMNQFKRILDDILSMPGRDPLKGQIKNILYLSVGPVAATRGLELALK